VLLFVTDPTGPLGQPTLAEFGFR